MDNPEIVKTNRRVIEGKLLTALEDGRTVAILASENDLQTLIQALRCLNDTKANEMASDFEVLKRAAFPR